MAGGFDTPDPASGKRCVAQEPARSSGCWSRVALGMPQEQGLQGQPSAAQKPKHESRGTYRREKWPKSSVFQDNS